MIGSNFQPAFTLSFEALPMNVVRFVLAVVGGLIAASVALPVVLVGLPLWLTGLATRTLAQWLEPRAIRWSSLFRFDPALGWTAAANTDVHCLEERDDVFRLRTGADGWPGDLALADSDVVVFGDSHAFGYGVDADRMFASLLKRPRVKPVAVPGYNLVQELLLIRQIAPKLAGKLALWLIYPGNDLYDNLVPSMNGYRTPFVRERNGSWEIVTSHLSPEKWTTSSGRAGQHYLPTLAAMYAPTHLSRRAYSACAYLIKEGAQACRRAETKLVVLALPCPIVLEEHPLQLLRSKARDAAAIDPRYPERQLGAICADAGVPFVELRNRIHRRHFKDIDDHLTVEGHEVLAGVIRDVYEDQQIILRSKSAV
jgi:hypothetical protein